MNKKIFSIIVLGTCLALFVPLHLKAQEAETSPTVDPEDVKGIREEVEKKARDLLEDIVNKKEKRGWIGTITELSATGFKMQSNEETRTSTISDQATIINQNREQINFDELTTNQRVIAMGYVQVDGTLDARRIVVIEEHEPREAKAIFGTITEKAAQDEIMLVKNSEESYELIFDQDSILEQRLDGETEEIEYDDLVAEQKVVAVISPTNGNTATYQVEKLLAITSPEPTEEPESTSSPTPEE